ncbi:MAG: hypothetical protein JXQ93_08340 [Flavobacteriaceae bacterium]
MKKQFKISIPEPCHEDWKMMTPKDKGKFCKSCSKTVIDFTKKSTKEIQDYLSQNIQKGVCGHFYKKQLDLIVIEIPTGVLAYELSFQKLFFLALLIVMGSSLMSCVYDSGKKQKIEKVVFVDSIYQKSLKTDASCSVNALENIPTVGKITNNELLDGMIKTVLTKDFNSSIDSIIELEEENNMIQGDLIMGMVIQEAPRFQEAKDFTREEAKTHFDTKISKFIRSKLTIWQQHLGLKHGQYKVIVTFKIDALGNINTIKIKSPDAVINKEIEKVLKQLPQFIPGTQKGKPISSSYTLPIKLVID